MIATIRISYAEVRSLVEAHVRLRTGLEPTATKVEYQGKYPDVEVDGFTVDIGLPSVSLNSPARDENS